MVTAARDGGAPASLAIGWRHSMIAISISAEAYAAIKAMLPEADSLPVQPDGLGGVRIWLEHKFVDRLRALRRGGESYSDVIIRLAEEEDDNEE
jgi:predicted CopG family antitoxin